MQINKLLCFNMLLISLLSIAGNSNADERDFYGEYKVIIENQGSESDSSRLHQLFDIQWEYQMYTFPTWATYIGRTEYDDRWTDNSIQGIERRKKESYYPLEVLETINRSKLSKEDKLNYDLFKLSHERSIEGDQFDGYLMPINQMGGIHQSVPSLFAVMNTKSYKDYDNILKRFSQVAGRIENTMELLEMGLAKGVTPPKVTLRELPQQIKNQIADEPKDAPMFLVFTEIPDDISVEEKNEILNRAINIYNDDVKPALEKLHDYVKNDYLPNCRETDGLSDLPNGRKWYEYAVKSYTTTDLTPDEIFNIGNSEVKRIRTEMEKIKENTDFKGNLDEFFVFLRTDPQFYHTSAEDLLQGYRDISKRADPKLIELFGLLPRLPYGVKAVPSYSEKSQTTAYYQSGSLEAGRPGYFYANTYALDSRPIWEMEALTLHEAVPGHHLQISIAQELQGLPEFRKRGWFTAYGEGWGLYSESLGEEMGFYQDPYSKFGQLTYEMWRAIRLVVDVGMHYKGWSRQEAIDFFTANVGKSDHDIAVEVDRYIVWPGQALAYKIGELKIKELRAFASGELGEMFDIREFHDNILGSGALPLDILEQKIKQWVEDKKKMIE